MINDIRSWIPVYNTALQKHHVYSTLKQRGNGRFNVEYTWCVCKQDGIRLNFTYLHVTLSNFEPLLRKFKHFITALINVEQLS